MAPKLDRRVIRRVKNLEGEEREVTTGLVQLKATGRRNSNLFPRGKGDRIKG